ncbi:unnamed protein product [Ectocarpus sp. 13 AM-2016]
MPPLPRLTFPSCALLGVVLLTTQQCANTARHPICRMLEDGGGHRRPTRSSAPQPYRCDGDHAEALCSKLDDDYAIPTVTGAHRTEQGEVTGGGDTASAGMRREAFPSGARQEDVRLSVPPHYIWWACKGTRRSSPGDEGDAGDTAWVDCDGYYAFGRQEVNPTCRSEPDEKGSDWFGLLSANTPENSEFIQPGRVEGLPHPRNLELLEADRGQSFEEVSSSSSGGVPAAQGAASQGGGAAAVQGAANQLVNAPADSECDELWRTWPAMQESAIANGTVVVFDLVSRVGNAFMDLRNVIQVARWLELGLVVNWKGFQGFRDAFDTGELKWDIDTEPFRRKAKEISRGVNPSGFHLFRFYDGFMVLCDHQLTMLASKMGIAIQHPDAMVLQLKKVFPVKIRYWISGGLQNGLPASQPCTWNMFVKRSPSMMRSLEVYNPWRAEGSSMSRFQKYIAFQIRTTEGETAGSFDPKIHTYIFNNLRSTVVCNWYFAATEEAKGTCPAAFSADEGDVPLFISSNSMSMARNCSAAAAGRKMLPGLVDVGVPVGDAHTTFSAHPKIAALKAFADFLYILDAEVVVRTASSFSGTAVEMKGMNCFEAKVSVEMPISGLYVCVPAGC